MKLTIDGQTYEVQVSQGTVLVDGHPFRVRVEGEGPQYVVYVNDRPHQVELPPNQRSPYHIAVDGFRHEAQVERAPATTPAPAAPPTARAAAPPGSVLAPVSGTITAIKVQTGQAVKAGDLLLVLEAMKMENEIKAPTKGTVKELKVAVGSRVSEGDVLAVLGE